MGFCVFCAHDAAVTRGQYLALSKAWWSSYDYDYNYDIILIIHVLSTLQRMSRVLRTSCNRPARLPATRWSVRRSVTSPSHVTTRRRPEPANHTARTWYPLNQSTNTDTWRTFSAHSPVSARCKIERFTCDST